MDTIPVEGGSHSHPERALEMNFVVLKLLVVVNYFKNHGIANSERKRTLSVQSQIFLPFA
jgi:hypothetical protein